MAEASAQWEQATEYISYHGARHRNGRLESRSLNLVLEGEPGKDPFGGKIQGINTSLRLGRGDGSVHMSGLAIG